MTEKPRFTRTAKIAAKALKEHGINKLPVDPFAIIAQHRNWKAMIYEQFASRHGITVDDVIEIAGSVDGCTFYQAKKDRYLILYNKNPLFINKPRRITWTLTHEIGHILLRHLEETGESKISRNTLTQNKYETLEKEANFFSSSVLAPYIVLTAMEVSEPEDISNLCGLSKEASQYRAEGLKKWKARGMLSENDMRVIFQFREFVYCKRCLNCGHGLVSVKANYCPICGFKLIWGEGIMIYNGFQVNGTGKAVACPRCENEEILEEDTYCRVCGVYLTNECAGVRGYDTNGNEYLERESCKLPAAGNARYCIRCGNPTTYRVQGLFRDWQEEFGERKADELREQKALEESGLSDRQVASAMGMPDPDDMDMPF